MNIDRLMDVLQTLRFESQRTLGLPGLLGAVVLVAAVVAFLSSRVVDDETARLAQSTRHARSTNALPHQELDRASLDAANLERLPDLLSTFDESGNDISTILARAQEAHLTLGSAHYQVATETSTRFKHYQVLLPVKDQYVTIRRFIATVLNSVPNAALQEIHVERPAVGDNTLDARIRFDLIYRTNGS
jgi:hypothetical protein